MLSEDFIMAQRPEAFVQSGPAGQAQARGVLFGSGAGDRDSGIRINASVATRFKIFSLAGCPGEKQRAAAWPNGGPEYCHRRT